MLEMCFETQLRIRFLESRSSFLKFSKVGRNKLGPCRWKRLTNTKASGDWGTRSLELKKRYNRSSTLRCRVESEYVYLARKITSTSSGATGAGGFVNNLSFVLVQTSGAHIETVLVRFNRRRSKAMFGRLL